jgi:hypothetical protein
MLLRTQLQTTCWLCCSFAVCLQAIGGMPGKPTYKEVESLVDAARKAKLEIFKVAQEASSLDREAVSSPQTHIM